VKSLCFRAFVAKYYFSEKAQDSKIQEEVQIETGVFDFKSNCFLMACAGDGG